MAIQLLPLVVGILRGAAMSLPRAGAFAGNAMTAFRLARKAHKAYKKTGDMFGGHDDDEQPEQFNAAALARQLGTPNPSQQQVAAEQSRIDQNNQKYTLTGRVQQGVEATGQGMKELAKFAVATSVATKGLVALGRMLHENAVQSLRLFNSQMAAEAAKQERFEMRYAQRRGASVQATTRRLGDSLRRNAEEWAPYRDLRENLTNWGLTMVTDLSTWFEGLLESMGITDMVRLINKRLGGDEKKKNPGGHLGTFVRDTLAGKHVGPLSGRPNERPGSRMN